MSQRIGNGFSHHPAEEMGLVDGLGGADRLQLGRPIGGAHQHRHAGLPGLDDRR